MAVELSQRVRDLLARAETIYVSGCAAEIADAPAILEHCTRPGAIVTGIFSPLINHRSYANSSTGLRVRSFFVTKALRQSAADGFVEFCPWRYTAIAPWLAVPGRFDVALVMVSPPDAEGQCSLGVQTDFLPGFIGNVGAVVGFINPTMPRTVGDSQVHVSQFAATIDYDVPLPEMSSRDPDRESVAIAESIVGLVPDGATVQFGVGQIPSQVLGRLGGHRGLRVHSGVIDDNILTLEAGGALDRDVPIVTGTAVGSARLYEQLSDAKRFSFRSVPYTHAQRTISRIPGFLGVNSVLRADLFGQVSAESVNGRLIATPGGLPDFVRGALDSVGGQSIIALRAGALPGQTGGIVASLGDPGMTTISATDADIVVTEFGIARLRGLSFDARAEAMIAIAAPEDRNELERAWRQIRAVGFGERRPAQGPRVVRAI